MKWYCFFFFLLIIMSCKKEEDPYEADIISGLTANISLDGIAYDSISGITGIIVKAIPTANRHGQTNAAMLFNRLDSAYIDFGDLANGSLINNDFTISFWFMVSDTLAPLAILSKRGVFGPWEYSIDNHFDKAFFTCDNWINDGTTTVYGTDPLKAGAAITINEWTHVAFVGDGTTLSVYRNGLLQPGNDTRKDSLFLQDTNAPFIIGNGGGYGKNYYFNGAIDDIRIYNVPLKSTSIVLLANQ